MADALLIGRRIFLAEDEYLIATDICRRLETEGAEVIGPVPSVSNALALLETQNAIDGAVLDINLRGELVFPVADWLMSRHVPIVFATGYDQAALPTRYASIARCEKPSDMAQIAYTVSVSISRASSCTP